MKIETQDISVSLDQPEHIRNSLVMASRNILQACKMQAVQSMPDYHNLLIIDEYERARYLANLLVQAGFRPLVMSTALEAFTRFLQIPFVPFALVLGQDDATHRLFLQRLLLQTMQKYEWEVPLIRLHYLSENMSSQYSQELSALSPLQQASPLLGPQGVEMPELQAPRKFLSQSLVDIPVPSQPLPSLPRIPRVRLTQHSPSGAPLTPPIPQKPLPNTQPVEPSRRFETVPAPEPGIPQHTPIPAFPFDEIEKYENQAAQKISLEGQNIGRYHILSALGNSSTSNVYKTYDRLREIDVAFKVLQTDALPYHILARPVKEYDVFQQEAELLQDIDHPHIVTVWNCGKSYVNKVSFTYKAMAYYAEGSLAQWLLRQGTTRSFLPRDVCHIALQLADALQYLHERHITFQNFKLTNLLVRRTADQMQQLHLMLVDVAVPQDGSFFSKSRESILYVAPERWYGQISAASDQYGLAAVVYELLTGRVPFQGGSEHIMKLLHSSMKPQPPSTYNPTVSPALDAVMLRALAKRPEDRFPSIALFVRAFQKYAI